MDLYRPTRRDRTGRPYPARRREPRHIWSFSPWGLPSCPAHAEHWWALTLNAEAPIPREGGPTFSSLPVEALAKADLAQTTTSAVSLSVALSMAPPSPVMLLPVRKHGALCCPDFPPSPPCSGKNDGAMRGMSMNSLHRSVSPSAGHCFLNHFTLSPFRKSPLHAERGFRGEAS